MIDRPIFLLGPGRSGSTLVNNLVTHHREVSYFVSWSSKYPRLPFLCVGSWLRSARLEKRFSRIRFYPGPTEPYRIWKYCFPDFWRVCREPCRDPRGAERLKRILKVHLLLQHRTRFLAKLTGPPMFTFLESIFPDARFVWIDRDPRAVAYSYSRHKKAVVPPGMTGDDALEEKLRQSAQRYLGIYDRLQTQEAGYHLLLYEDFLRDPAAEMRRLLEALELGEDPRLLRWAGEWPLRDANRAWREKLAPPHQRLLEGLLEKPLSDRGYL
jgi:hypothetical protein